MWGKFWVTLSPLFSTLTDLAKRLPLWRNDRSIPPELPTTRLEQPSAVSFETEQQQPPDNNHHDRPQIDNMMNMQVIGACLATISVILQALRTHATLPAALFGIFLVLLEMALLALLVSVYLRRHYHKASRVMEHVAVFFFAVALLLAIWMTLHPPLRQMSIALFIIGFTVVILANRSLRDWV